MTDGAKVSKAVLLTEVISFPTRLLWKLAVHHGIAAAHGAHISMELPIERPTGQSFAFCDKNSGRTKAHVPCSVLPQSPLVVPELADEMASPLRNSKKSRLMLLM